MEWKLEDKNALLNYALNIQRTNKAEVSIKSYKGYVYILYTYYLYVSMLKFAVSNATNNELTSHNQQGGKLLKLTNWEVSCTMNIRQLIQV